VAAGSHRVLAVVTDPVQVGEPIEEIRRCAEGEAVEVRVVVPAVEENAFRHLMGDVDGPAQRAEQILETTLSALRGNGIDAWGSVGDSDPVLAAEDALRDQSVDEVLIFEHTDEQARWFEDGLFQRAQESLAPPLRMVVVEAGDGGGPPDHVVQVEEAPAGTASAEEREVGTAYLPGLSPADFAGILAGIVGTIVVIILAAAATSSQNPTGWDAVAIGIAIFTALVNMAHVVGLTLFESVRYRGGFAKFFRTLSLIGTPTALLVNLLILILT
jgi:hypothetical protein